MNLREFFDYKNQLMGDILKDEKIVSLIDENLPFSQAKSLRYKNVFPVEYVPETIQEGLTYVCFDVDIKKVIGKTFLEPVIYVWIFAHRSKLFLSEGGVRTDELCIEICNKLNGSRYYGLGELNFDSARRFAPITDYQGKVLTFYTKDFNRQYDGAKPVPANRKTG